MLYADISAQRTFPYTPRSAIFFISNKSIPECKGGKHIKDTDTKEQIRQRYKGISIEELEVIPAIPQESFFNDSSEKRVAIYARVSTDDARQTSSYELQKNYYRDVVDRHPGWTLTKIYADEGISGKLQKH